MPSELDALSFISFHVSSKQHVWQVFLHCKDSNRCVFLWRSAQQRINQMNKKKAAGNQVRSPELSNERPRFRVVRDLRRNSSPLFSVFPSDRHISCFPEGFHAVSSQLCVWLWLNAGQSYIMRSCYSSTAAPPGSAPHPTQSGSGACYTLMANSCGMSIGSRPLGEFRRDISGVRGRP